MRTEIRHGKVVVCSRCSHCSFRKISSSGRPMIRFSCRCDLAEFVDDDGYSCRWFSRRIRLREWVVFTGAEIGQSSTYGEFCGTQFWANNNSGNGNRGPCRQRGERAPGSLINQRARSAPFYILCLTNS